MTIIAHRPPHAWASAHRVLLAVIGSVVAVAVATVLAVLMTTSGTASSTGTQIHYQHVVDTCNEAAQGTPC